MRRRRAIDDSWCCLALVRSVLVRRLLRSCWGQRSALVAGVLGWIGTCVAAARVPRCAVVRRAGRKELIAVAVALSLPPVSHSRSRHGRRPRRESSVGVLEPRSALVISRARRAIAAAGHGHRTGRTRHVEQYASGPLACSRRIFPGPSCCPATNATATAIGSFPSSTGCGGSERAWAFVRCREVSRSGRCIVVTSRCPCRTPTR